MHTLVSLNSSGYRLQIPSQYNKLSPLLGKFGEVL